MRHAVRQPEQEPAPERSDLDAKAAAVLDGQLALIARAQSLLAGCPDPLLLRQLITETIASGIHFEELRGELARYTAANAGNEVMLAALRAREKSRQDGPPAPRSGRHAAEGGWRAGPILRLLGAAFAALGLKSLWKHAAHAVTHPAALTAHTVKLAAAATAVPAAGVLIAGAVIVTHASSPSGPSAGAGASVPGWHTSASPIPSGSLIALTKPKRGKKQLMASGLPLPCCAVGPQPSASSSSSSAAPSVQASVQAGPAQLSVSTTALDLTSLTSETITLSATGAGWVSWKVALPADPLTLAAQADLDFSATHGVLQAGQSTTVTVSLDPAQLLDGNLSETFTIGGVSVRATLPPLPVTIPSVLPSALPSVLPSL